MDVEVGTIIAERYRVVGLLGRGDVAALAAASSGKEETRGKGEGREALHGPGMARPRPRATPGALPLERQDVMATSC